jgi:hypothetical protein
MISAKALLSGYGKQGKKKDFSYYGIYHKHSSVYTVFNFTCTRSAEKKMRLVHHKNQSTNYRMKPFKNLVNSTVELFHVHRHRCR